MIPASAPIGSDIRRISTAVGKIAIPIPKYQEKLEKKRKLGDYSGKHTFEGDEYVCLGQRMVNPHFFHKFIYNHMLLIATCMKLGLVLHVYPLTCIIGGIRDQTLKSLTPCVVRWPKIDW
jgi:hypothetical protein